MAHDPSGRARYIFAVVVTAWAIVTILWALA